MASKATVQIAAKVSGNSAVAELTAAMNDLKKSTGGLASGLAGVNTALKALGAAYVLREGVQFLKNIIDTADNLRDMSQKTGLSISALSGLKTAAELSGVGVEALQKGLIKFNVAVADAKDESSKAASAFKLIGIKDANLKNNSELLSEVANRFEKLSDGASKTKAAVLLFGKSGADLIPVLNEGADALKKYGLNIDDLFGDRADQFNDTLTLLKVQVQNFAIDGLKVLLPVLQDVATAVLQLPKNGKDAVGFFDILGSGVRYAAVGIETLVNFIADVIDYIKSLSKTVGAFFEVASSSTNAALSGQFSAAGQYFKEFLDQSNKDGDAYAKRSEARVQASVDFAKRILKNDVFLGEGTLEQIRKRTEAETAPKARRKGTAATTDVELDKQALAGIKFAEDKIRLINAETDALGENEQERKKLQLFAELEQHGLKEDTDLYIQYAIAIEAALDKQKKLKEKPELGAKKALEDYVAAANDFASQTQNVVSSTLKGLENAFVDFFTKGKADWKEFANAIIAEIVRVAVQRSIIAPIAGAFLGAFSPGAAAASSSTITAGGGLGGASFAANGGIMSAHGMLPLRQYAAGGIAKSPQMAVFGEGSMNEAYVPLPDGRSIPVSMKGGGGGDNNVSVTVNVSSGDQSMTANSERGAQIGKLVSNLVKNELINQQRPGGILR